VKLAGAQVEIKNLARQLCGQYKVQTKNL